MVKNTPIGKVAPDTRKATKIALRGLVFGRLTVLRRLPNRGSKVYWACRCACGGLYAAEGYALRSGTTTHCGCDTSRRASAHTIHGGCGTRAYSIWKNMLRRCELTTHPDYGNYGGRGILVCVEWHDFAKFLSDMGEPPEQRTLDRRDNDGPYSKANCRWATRTMQSRNKRTTLIVPFRGTRAPLISLAERAGVPYKTVWDRIDRGWSVGRALCL